MPAPTGIPVLDVVVHCDPNRGKWVMTPLSSTVGLELRRPAEGNFIPDEKDLSIIWRLDGQIFDVPSRHLHTALHESIPPMRKRLKQVADGMKRLNTVSAKLDRKIAIFEADKVEVMNRQRRLDECEKTMRREQAQLRQHEEEHRAEVQKHRLRIHEQRRGLDQDTEKLASHRRVSEERIRKTLVELEAKLQCPQRAGDVGVYSPEAFFLAVQDEFASAIPVLPGRDVELLQETLRAPEEAFREARESFMAVPGDVVDDAAMSKRVDATVLALLSLQHIKPEQEPPAGDVPKLEFLFSSCRALSRYSNSSGRWPLAFATSSVAVWCATPLSENLAKLWEELESTRVKEASTSHKEEKKQKKPVEQAEATGRRLQLLERFNSLSKRLLRCWADHGHHRRRFIRYAANSVRENESRVTDADIRLLLCAHSATPAELAAHIRKVCSFADSNKEVSYRFQQKIPSKRLRTGETAPRPIMVKDE